MIVIALVAIEYGETCSSCGSYSVAFQRIANFVAKVGPGFIS